MSSGLRGEPAAEHRRRNAGHRFTEAVAASSAAHGFPACGAGIGEVQVLHGDVVDAMTQCEVDEPGDRVPDLGIPACGRPGKVEIDAVRSADRVAMGVEASHREVVAV